MLTVTLRGASCRVCDHYNYVVSGAAALTVIVVATAQCQKDTVLSREETTEPALIDTHSSMVRAVGPAEQVHEAVIRSVFST